MFKIFPLAALTLGLAAAATPIAAQTTAAQTTAQTSVAVPYADLNLTTPEGRKALDRRLARAATKVCGGEPDMRRMSERAAYRDCLAAAKQNYQSQRLAALEAANAKRVAVLADKLGFIAVR